MTVIIIFIRNNIIIIIVSFHCKMEKLVIYDNNDFILLS